MVVMVLGTTWQESALLQHGDLEACELQYTRRAREVSKTENVSLATLRSVQRATEAGLALLSRDCSGRGNSSESDDAGEDLHNDGSK